MERWSEIRSSMTVAWIILILVKVSGTFWRVADSIMSHALFCCFFIKIYVPAFQWCIICSSILLWTRPIKSGAKKSDSSQNWPLVKIINFCPIFMKIGQNYYLRSWLFWQNFIRLRQKLCGQWQIFGCFQFSFPQTLESKCNTVTMGVPKLNLGTL